MGQLCAELNDFNNWYLLGLLLNVSKDILDSIDKLHDTKVGKCTEMIQHWISNSDNPSWETVHEALRNISESVLAAKIAKKYHVQSSRIGGEVSSVPDPEHSGSSEEISTATVWTSSEPIVRREQWRISTYFCAILDVIIEILESEVKPDKLVRFLRLQCHPLNPEALYIDRQILQPTNSISEIMQSLVPGYINYMDTVLLEAIVDHFEVEEAQRLLQEYHDRYPHLRQLSDMPDPVPDERLDLTRRKRLRAKYDGDFESARARDVKRMRTSIESATGIDHWFVTPAQHNVDGDTYTEQQSTSKKTLTPGKFRVSWLLL